LCILGEVNFEHGCTARRSRHDLVQLIAHNITETIFGQYLQRGNSRSRSRTWRNLLPVQPVAIFRLNTFFADELSLRIVPYSARRRHFHGERRHSDSYYILYSIMEQKGLANLYCYSADQNASGSQARLRCQLTFSKSDPWVSVSALADIGVLLGLFLFLYFFLHYEYRMCV
jgi:hypothetical protein